MEARYLLQLSARLNLLAPGEARHLEIGYTRVIKWLQNLIDGLMALETEPKT